MDREIIWVLVIIFILFLTTLLIIIIRHKANPRSQPVSITKQTDYSPNVWKTSRIDDAKKTINNILVDFSPKLPATLIDYVSTCTVNKFSKMFHWAKVNEVLQHIISGGQMDSEMFDVYLNCLNSQSDILVKSVSNENNTASFNECMSHLPTDIKRTFTTPLTHCIR